MSAMSHEVLLVSSDKTLGASMTDALQNAADFSFAHIGVTIDQPVDAAALRRAAIVVVDLDASRRDHLLGLQAMMMRAAPQTIILVVAESYSEAVQRWFLQIRVHDLLRKPLAGSDIVTSCRRLLSGPSEPPTDHAEVTCFLPAAGGVGNTTLALEAAMQMLSRASDKSSVALVDLDLYNDACADYLDLEPRLDFAEIGEKGERVDIQLLEAMTTRHDSGLALIAAPSLAGQMRAVSRAAVLRVLDTVATRYQSVVVDLPRMWHPWTDDILTAADRTFVVTDMTVPGLRFARRLTEQLRARLVFKAPVSVIVNRFERQKFILGAGLRRADVVRTLDGMFAGEIVNNYQLVREAIDRGAPLESVKPGNSVSVGLKRILFDGAQSERRAS